MNANPKSTRKARPARAAGKKAAAPAQELPAAIAAFCHNGVDKIAQAQKEGLDIVAQQSVNAINIFNQAIGVGPGFPAGTLIEFAGKGVEQLIETQKTLLNMFVEQSAAGAATVADQAGTGTGYLSAVAELLQQTAGKAAEAHKAVLDFASQQNKSIAGIVKYQAVMTGNKPVAAAAEVIQRGFDTAIETQKGIVDVASKTLNFVVGKA